MNKQYCPYCMSPVESGEACQSCGLTAGSYTPNENHLPPGTVLNGRYLIGRVLGEGGFGITYIGCDLRLELKVAIKEYFPIDKVQRISSVSLDISIPSSYAEHGFQSGKDRFLEEARIMARMDKQPEIVSVRDFFECHNTAYIVMEYVEGTTFKQLVTQRGGGLPAKELLELVEPLFGALTNLHELGLIHRDISPDNLMLERGRVRLIDFGCARQPERGEATMTIVLKHGYAPIEQYTNRGQGPWTDVYALSATIYYCLVGQRPPQAMDRASEDELILPRKLGVELTEAQEQAILRGMGIRRSQRFASVAQFYAALYRAPAEDPIPIPDPDPDPILIPDPVPPVPTPDPDPDPVPIPEPVLQEKPWWKDWRGIAAMAVALLMVVGMATVLFPNKEKEQPQEDDALAEEQQEHTDSIPPQQDPESHDPAEKQEDANGNIPVFSMKDQVYPMDQPANAGLFLDAYVIENDEHDLNWHLEQGAETLKIENTYIRMEGHQVLTQNLMVGENAVLDLGGILTVAPGVTLQVAENGTIHSSHLIRLEQGAQLNVLEDGNIRIATILMEDGQTALQCSDSEAIRRIRDDAGIKLVDYRLSAFENATTVTSVTEFRNAVENPDTEAIIIAGDLALNDYEHFELKIPVWVEEDARIRSSVSNGYPVLTLRHVLINHGSLQTALQIQDGGCLENHADLMLQAWADAHSVVINHGLFRSQSNVDVKYGSCLYNYGSMHLKTSKLLVLGGDVRNFGELQTAGNVTIPTDGHLENHGTMTILKGGHLYNRDMLENHGTLILEDGSHLQNEGSFYYGHQLQPAEGAYLENHGAAYSHETGWVPVFEDRAPILLGNNFYDVPGEVVEVYTVGEFLSALQNQNVDTIVWNSDMTLPKSVVIEKKLVINQPLRMAENTTLEICGGVENNSTIVAYDLQFRNGGYLTNGRELFCNSLVLGVPEQEENSGSILNYGVIGPRESSLSLSLYGQSALIHWGELHRPGEIQLHHNAMLDLNGHVDELTKNLTVYGGLLLNSDYLTFRNADLRVENGMLRLYGGLTLLEESMFYLGEYAIMDVLEGTWELDESSAMENHGDLTVFGFDWYRPMLRGMVKNFGRWNVGIPMTVGTFHNLGEVRLYEGYLDVENEFLGNDPIVG